MTDVEVRAVRPLFHLGMVMLAGLSVIGDFMILLSIPAMPFVRCLINLFIPLAVFRNSKMQKNAAF